MALEQDVQSAAPDSPRTGYSLWCGVCGQTVYAAFENLAVYSEVGWPRCCGEVMYCGPSSHSSEQQPD